MALFADEGRNEEKQVRDGDDDGGEGTKKKGKKMKRPIGRLKDGGEKRGEWERDEETRPNETV